MTQGQMNIEAFCKLLKNYADNVAETVMLQNARSAPDAVDSRILVRDGLCVDTINYPGMFALCSPYKGPNVEAYTASDREALISVFQAQEVGRVDAIKDRLHTLKNELFDLLEGFRDIFIYDNLGHDTKVSFIHPSFFDKEILYLCTIAHGDEHLILSVDIKEDGEHRIVAWKEDKNPSYKTHPLATALIEMGELPTGKYRMVSELKRFLNEISKKPEMNSGPAL